jgi:hypothetical protein
MANTINIAQLDIDLNPLIKSTQEVGTAIESIKKKQDELKKSGQTLSAEYIQNQADLKSLTSAYNANIKAITDSTQAQANQANRLDLINLALNQEVISIKDARDQNALLNKLRNEANLTTEEGRNELKLLNDRLDENNKFIKENADQYLKQKINIGNYSESIQDAVANLNPLNGGLSAFVGRAQEAGGVGKLLTTSLGAIGQGILGVTRASLAFIATPIGAVIAVIGLAIGALVNYLKNTQSGIDAVTSVTRPLQAIFSALSTLVSSLGKGLVEAFSNPKKALTDLADFVKQNLINRFTAFAEILDGIISLDFKKVTNGVLQAGTGVENLTDKIQAGAEATGKFLDDAAKKGAEIDRLTKEIERSQLDYNRQVRLTGDLIDEQLLISKDASRSYAERGAAAYEIIRLTAELGAQEEEIIKKKLKQLDIEQSLKDVKDLTIEDQQKRIELENELDAAQDRGLNSELDQSRVLSGLRKEQQQQAEEARKAEIERRQKILDDALAKSQAELNLFISTQGIKAKSLQEELSLIEGIAQKKFEINQKEFNASKKTAVDKLQLETANNDVKNELIKGQTDLVIANAQRELGQFELINKTKIDQNKFLTEQLVADEKIRLDLIKKEQLDFEALRLKTKVINEQQYSDAIRSINEEDKAKREELRLAEETATNEKRVLDLENLLAQNQTDFDNELALKLQRLDLQKQAELKSAEKTGADKNIILKKYSDAEVSLRNAVEQSKLSLISQGLSQAKELFAENTTAYKALAVAEASINTYMAASLALKTYAYPVGGIFAGLAIAQGLLNVSKIVGVKFEKGGIQQVGGKRHSAGGTKFYGEDGTAFEAEAGEGIGVLNRGAFGAFMDFNNRFNGGSSSPSFMEGGGIITQGVRSTSLDINQLAQVTIAAIEAMPSPIVAVTDINRGQNNMATVESGANF